MGLGLMSGLDLISAPYRDGTARPGSALLLTAGEGGEEPRGVAKPSEKNYPKPNKQKKKRHK